MAKTLVNLTEQSHDLGSGDVLIGTGSGNTTIASTSTNVDSTLVQRDGSGNFSAGTVTANLSGNVTGNLTGTVETASQPNITSVGTQTSALNMGGNQINDISDPSAAQDAATKNYVDAAINGLAWKAPSLLATTAPLPVDGVSYAYSNGASGVGATITALSMGVVSIDGTPLALNERILIKNEVGANAPYNGIYLVTTAGSVSAYLVLTRTTDFNSPATINAGDAIFVETGSVNGQTSWLQTDAATIVVGTSNITFVQFSGPGSYTAGNGLTLTGTQFSLSSPVSISNGGTGETTQAAAITNLTGTQTSGYYLRSNGTNASLSAIQAGDVPTLNQNTTGNASTATNLAGGAAGEIPYQSAASTTLFTAAGTSGQVLTSGGTSTPTWTTLPTSYTFVVREYASGSGWTNGVTNGTTSSFTLAHTPAASGGSSGTCEEVYLNGVLQDEGGSNDYVLSGATVTFNSSLSNGDKVMTNYRY